MKLQAILFLVTVLHFISLSTCDERNFEGVQLHNTEPSKLEKREAHSTDDPHHLESSSEEHSLEEPKKSAVMDEDSHLNLENAVLNHRVKRCHKSTTTQPSGRK
ncbi:hypothetical protein CHUAL_009361 [Chamberlinius hualienensis]